MTDATLPPADDRVPPAEWAEADWLHYRLAGGVVNPYLWAEAGAVGRGRAVKAGLAYLALVAAYGKAPPAADAGAGGAPAPADGCPGDVSRETPLRAALRAEAEGALDDLRGGSVAVGGPPR